MAAAVARDVEMVAAPEPVPQPREKPLPAVVDQSQPGKQPLPGEEEDTLGSPEARAAQISDAPEPEPAAQLPAGFVARKLCHQCRQYRTEVWAICNGDDGEGTKRFCPNCLTGRYHKEEPENARKPGWICPKCRGICNCSCCRKKNGQKPTGKLHSLRKDMGGSVSVHEILQKMTQKELDEKLDQIKRERQMETLRHIFGFISVQEINGLMTEEKRAQTHEMLDLDEKKGKKRARKTKMTGVHVAEIKARKGYNGGGKDR